MGKHIHIIVCVARNGAIGKAGGLLYRLRDDMKRFKELTTGHTVLMGRRTFESLPKGALPQRRNIVLTSENREWPETAVFHSMEEALAHCGEEEVFVIGGSSVYGEALPMAQTLYLTEVDDLPEDADTFFPKINREEWKETARESHEADERNEKPFCFITLERRTGLQ